MCDIVINHHFHVRIPYNNAFYAAFLGHEDKQPTKFCCVCRLSTQFILCWTQNIDKAWKVKKIIDHKNSPVLNMEKGML